MAWSSDAIAISSSFHRGPGYGLRYSTCPPRLMWSVSYPSRSRSYPVCRRTSGDRTMVRGATSRTTSSSRSSPCVPRTRIRRNRSWLCHWLPVKSYTPDRSPPKSTTAMVVVAGLGSGSSVHPSRVSGSTSGAVVRLARTVTGPRPASSRPRMRDTAWHWWVEETCTWVGVPMAPERTSAARAACAGMSRYCSATWTRPDPPTRAHRSRSPDRSGAGGVSARTGTPSATASVITAGVAGHGTAVTTKSGRADRRHPASEPNAGTGKSLGVRTTAPTHVRSGREAASRQKNPARHPAPTTANDVTPVSLEDGVTAVDHQHAAGHEGGRGTGEVHHARRDLLRGGVPALGRVLDPVPPEPRYVDRSHLGVDVPGCDGVDPDAQRRPLGGERLRQVVYRRLRGVVRRLPLRPVDDLPGHRPDVDDRPAAGPGHHPTEGLAAVPHPSEVHVDDLLPLGVGDLQSRPVDARTGVVHQHVNPAHLGDDVA